MRKLTHGMCYTPTYHSWQSMKARCKKDNKHYGGKGIKVCDRWRDSFINFLADMGEKPTARHTIERKDASKDYEPGNCVWATYSQQNRNYGRNVLVTVAGESLCAQDADAKLGLRKGTIARRIKRGWSVERAMASPLIRSRAADLSGMRFSRLTVIERSGSTPFRKNSPAVALWMCRCDCGNTKTIRADVLKSGSTQSCGCLRRERSVEIGRRLHLIRKKRGT